jgi:hypothetical protein
MLVLRYTIAETSCVPIIRVLIIHDIQCVLFKYSHKAKLVACLNLVRFMNEVWILLCLASMLMGWILGWLEHECQVWLSWTLYLLKLLGHNLISVSSFAMCSTWAALCAVEFHAAFLSVMCSAVADFGWLWHRCPMCSLCLLSELLPACLSCMYHTSFVTDTLIAGIRGKYFLSNSALYCAGRLGAVPAAV